MTRGVRRSPVAARLKAVYGSVDNVDAFAGMISEKHLAGSEFGELQQAIWAKQFLALRDGDRFFYGNDPGLSLIQAQYGLDFHHSLADIIAANTDIAKSDLNDNVFLVADDDIPAATCSVTYHVDSTWTGEYQVSFNIKNLTSTTVHGWTVGFQFPGGQNIKQLERRHSGGRRGNRRGLHRVLGQRDEPGADEYHLERQTLRPRVIRGTEIDGDRSWESTTGRRLY